MAAGLITGLHAPAAREELVMMGPGYRRDDPADAPGRVRPRTGGAAADWTTAAVGAPGPAAHGRRVPAWHRT